MNSADACADSEEITFLALINDYRTASGQRPLSISASLSSAAAYHSVDMAANGYLAHTLLDGTTATFTARSRAEAAGRAICAAGGATMR